MRKIKLIFPVIAFFFAIGGALATTNNNTLADRVTDHPTPGGDCRDVGSCSGSGSACKDGDINLYKIVSSTSCSVQALGSYTK